MDSFYRNNKYNNNTNFTNHDEEKNRMSQFYNTIIFNMFIKLLTWSIGQVSTEQMGIEVFSWDNLVDFVIFGCFIFVKAIMFMNIFTAISVGEVKDMIQNAEAEAILIIEKNKRNNCGSSRTI